MTPVLYAHPFSSYCQKVLIALYENDTPFTFRMLDDAASFSELEALWPLKRFPVLRDGNTTVIEASIIIEYLQIHYPGLVRLIPEDQSVALQVRFMDRFFDNYIMSPAQKVVSNQLRAEGERDPKGVSEAQTMLETAYGWLNGVMKDRHWAAGKEFSLADCAAAPSLFYADWVHRIDDRYAQVRAYRSRLLARPSAVRTVNEARPYRALFPLGAPNRD
jgi:glutathione S-transferase